VALHDRDSVADLRDRFERRDPRLVGETTGSLDDAIHERVGAIAS
jgi:hypothetical protein